jgi:hypothetical protein
MKCTFKSPFNRFRRFRRRTEGGVATIEFVLMFLPMFVLAVSGFEMGLLMTRQVMLERGMDLTVREVRLNTNQDYTETDLRQSICSGAGIIEDCLTKVRLEMLRIDPDNWTDPPAQPSCANLSEPFKPARNFENGTQNELMLLRACGKFEPMLSDFGLGWTLSRMYDDAHYRLYATSAFVMEPL